MRLLRRSSLLVLALVASCGGGDDSTGPSGGSGSTCTATIDGSTAFTGTLSVQGSLAGGILALGATQNAGQGTVRQINIAVASVTGLGTYTFGPGSLGSSAIYTETAGAEARVWTTGIAGGTGTVTVTEHTTASMTGTFSFTGIPGSPGVTGNKVVTNGHFYVIFPQAQ